MSSFDGRWAATLTLLVVACGARTELEVSSEDLGSPVDASVDAPLERCDGLDDDGDGRIDEGLPTVDCGLGACRRSACDLALCVPGAPSMEACGGGDDDCDGLVDEGLPFGELGPAVEVREGAGGYDRCGTCSWAKDPILIPRGAGVFVTWNHGIYGGEEIPNIWGRSLDDEARPIGPPELLSERVQLGGQRIRGLEPEAGLLFASERVGSDDRARIWRVGPDGVEEVEGDGAFERCSRANTFTFVGDRLVSACTGRGMATLRSRRIGEEPIELELEVDDMFYGAVLHGRPEEGELLLASYHVDTDLDERWMSFTRLTPTLEVIQPMTRTDAVYTRAELAFPTPEGWLWWRASWPDGVQGQRLDFGGQPIADLEPYPFRVSNPPLAHVALGGGTHLVAIPAGNPADTYSLVRIGPQGELLDQTDAAIPPNPGGEADFAAHFDLIAHGDEYWTAWIGSYAEDGEPNHVHVQRFGCVSP